MIFLPRKHRFNPKYLNSIADDLIEIKKNALDKSAFRLSLIDKRLHEVNDAQLPLTEQLIYETTKQLCCKDIDEAVFAKTLRKLSRGLDKQYKYLLKLLRRLS